MQAMLENKIKILNLDLNIFKICRYILRLEYQHLEWLSLYNLLS